LIQKKKKIRSIEYLKNEIQQVTKAIKVYTPKKEVHTIMKTVLQRFKKTLDKVSNSWQGLSNNIEGLSKMNDSKEFYRLWALLQFIYCMEEKENVGFSDLELFGHGFFYGGLSVVYLYAQDKRFLGFNFTDHILHIDQLLEYQSKDRETISIFLKNATRMQTLNNSIISTFRTLYTVPTSTMDTFVAPETDDYSKLKIITMDIKEDPKSEFKKNLQHLI